MEYIAIFILGIIFWQLVTFIVTIVTNEDRGAEVGSLFWWFSVNAIGTIIVKVFKVNFREINYKRLYKKWKKAIKKQDYNFTEFRRNNGKYWTSSFNKLITSNDFKEYEKYLKER